MARTTVHGGSQRGPAALDEAKRNRGLGAGEQKVKPGEDRALSSGRTVAREHERPQHGPGKQVRGSRKSPGRG